MPAVPMDAQDGPGINPTMGLGAAQQEGMPLDDGQTIAGAQGSNGLTGSAGLGGLFGPMSDPARQGVIQAGLGMLAGTSPHAMVNIGRGGQVGYAAYQQAVAAEQRKAQEALQNRIAEEKLRMMTEEFKQRQLEFQENAPLRQAQVAQAQRNARSAEQIAAERAALADRYELTGEARQRFILSGELPGSSAGKIGLQPIYGRDAQGNPVVLQPTSTGRLVLTDIPDGVSVNRYQSAEELAAATARGRQTGEGTGKAKVDLPGVEAVTDRIVRQIEAVENDPNLPNITGWQAYLPTLLPGNVTTQEKAKQLTGAAFLMAFESLKGGGQITEIEGAKATAALARLENLRQDDAGYKEALAEFKREVIALRDLARRKAQGGAPAAPAGGGGSGGWSAQRVK